MTSLARSSSSGFAWVFAYGGATSRRFAKVSKPAASAYQGHEAILSGQPIAHQLAESEAEQAALCMLTRTETVF